MGSRLLVPMPDPSDPLELPDLLRGKGYVSIHHPGYGQQLFSIPCFPCLESTPPCIGAHLGLILDACEIIANNQSGFLSTSADETFKIPSNDRDLLLVPGIYYYHIHASNPKYPIVPEFNVWTPPFQLPEHWRNVNKGPMSSAAGSILDLSDIGTSWSTISSRIKSADIYCAMTYSSSRLNACHLVPTANEKWFLAHIVYQTFTNQMPSIDSPENIITLRTDLNALGIDQGHFVFVPIRGNLTIYFITNGLPDLAHEFHHRLIYLPERISMACVYYRFAWSILESIKKRSSVRDMPHVSVPAAFANYKIQKLECQRTIRGSHTAAVTDDHGQPSRSDDVAMQDAFSLSPSNDGDGDGDGLAHLLDLSPICNPEFVFALAAQDERIKREVGATFDESNIHLLSAYDAGRGWYPGFSKYLDLKASYIQKNPQVRATTEAVTGRFDDGYESESWGWGVGDDESEESEERDEPNRVRSGQLISHCPSVVPVSNATILPSDPSG